MNKGNAMHVYSVMGGYDYEGFDGNSMQLFDCKSAAEVYAKDIKKNWNYDYVEVKVIEVQQHSAIAA
jgi:hypothetical protein